MNYNEGEMIGNDNAAVCKNGHVANAHVQEDPEYNVKHCTTCGDKVIYKCECNTPVMGQQVDTRGCFEPPSYCHECGKAHAWTEIKMKALEEFIAELDELSEVEMEQLQQSIPDIIAETPSSSTAILRVKKLATKLSALSGKLFLKLATEVACESVKKELGL